LKEFKVKRISLLAIFVFLFPLGISSLNAESTEAPPGAGANLRIYTVDGTSFVVNDVTQEGYTDLTLSSNEDIEFSKISSIEITRHYYDCTTITDSSPEKWSLFRGDYTACYIDFEIAFTDGSRKKYTRIGAGALTLQGFKNGVYWELSEGSFPEYFQLNDVRKIEFLK
jgi:hypothetical protein